MTATHVPRTGAHRAPSETRQPRPRITLPTYPTLLHRTNRVFEWTAGGLIGVAILTALLGWPFLLRLTPPAWLTAALLTLIGIIAALGLILTATVAVLFAIAAVEKRGPQGLCGASITYGTQTHTCAVTAAGHPGACRSAQGLAWIEYRNGESRWI